MNTETIFRLVFLVVSIGYLLPRIYFRWKASKADLKGEIGMSQSGESKLRLALMGLSGLGINVSALLWMINPDWLPWAYLDTPDRLRWIGAIVGLFAILVGYLAHSTLGTSFTPYVQTRVEHRLVTEGIYSWIRHPVYASFFVLFAAFFLISTSWLLGVFALVYSVVIIQRVQHEEAMMIDAFGNQYRQYIQLTGRFVPRLRN